MKLPFFDTNSTSAFAVTFLVLAWTAAQSIAAPATSGAGHDPPVESQGETPHHEETLHHENPSDSGESHDDANPCGNGGYELLTQKVLVRYGSVREGFDLSDRRHDAAALERAFDEVARQRWSWDTPISEVLNTPIIHSGRSLIIRVRETPGIRPGGSPIVQAEESPLIGSRENLDIPSRDTPIRRVWETLQHERPASRPRSSEEALVLWVVRESGNDEVTLVFSYDVWSLQAEEPGNSSNPSKPFVWPELTIEPTAGGGVTVTSTPVPVSGWRIEGSPDLSAGSWVPLVALAPNAPAVSLYLTAAEVAASNAPRFFRLGHTGGYSLAQFPEE